MTPNPQAKTIDDALADFAKDIRNGYAKEGKLRATQAITQAMLDIPELQDELVVYGDNKYVYDQLARNDLRTQIKSAIKLIGGE